MRVGACYVVAFVVLGVAVAGCGSADEDDGGSSAGAATTMESSAPEGAAAATVSVSETDFSIDPANPRIAKAGVVTFKVSNDGQAPHALEVEGPKGEVQTDTIEPGRSATLRADLSKPGRYTWYCPVGDHRDRGMEGEITVASGGGEAGRDSGGGSYGY